MYKLLSNLWIILWLLSIGLHVQQKKKVGCHIFFGVFST